MYFLWLNQRGMLEHCLGEGHGLIDRIMESTSSSSSDLTLEEKISEFQVAPSKVTAILRVARFIFGRPWFVDLNDFRRMVSSNTFPPESGWEDHILKGNHKIAEFMECISIHWKETVNVTVEEAAGYTILGMLVMKFVTVLQHEQSNSSYKCHPQRVVARNSNPASTDSCIIIVTSLFNVSVTSYISLVLYEYKPSVNTAVLMIDPKFLIELFMQAYYVMRYEKQKMVLACLTDLFCWYYFMLKLTDSKLEVVWYHKLVSVNFKLNN